MNDTKTLDALMTPVPADAGAFLWEVPEGWLQGRGAFGGLVLGALVRAMEASVDASREQALRTVTATLCGPTEPGTARIVVDILRAGSGTTTVAARLVQEGELRAHVVGLFGRARDVGEVASWCDLEPPEITHYSEIDIAPMQPPLAPVFTQNMAFRVADHFPFVGGSERAALGWVSAKNPGESRDAAYITALADAWWPTLYATTSYPRPTATISFTLELLAPFEGLDPQAPVIHTARAAAARDGFFVEYRELWGEDGRLLSLNQQTFCVIK